MSINNLAYRHLFHIIEDAFTAQDIAEIFAHAKDLPRHNGTIFSTADKDSSLRRSQISWLRDDRLKDKLWTYVTEANQRYFDLELDGQADIQFTCYDSTESGHYDWHQDVNFASQDTQDRKISLTIQLSASDAYEGGDFEFEDIITTADFRAKGTMILFPSYLRHRVMPVTSGTRYSLVAWFFGPRWR